MRRASNASAELAAYAQYSQLVDRFGSDGRAVRPWPYEDCKNRCQGHHPDEQDEQVLVERAPVIHRDPDGQQSNSDNCQRAAMEPP